jgi:predicted site-specific integrase-resolvase
LSTYFCSSSPIKEHETKYTQINHISVANYIKKRQSQFCMSYDAEAQLSEQNNKIEKFNQQQKDNKDNIEDFLSLSRFQSSYHGDSLNQEPKIKEIFNYINNNK